VLEEDIFAQARAFSHLRRQLMQEPLSIVPSEEGEPCLDSRLLAQRLGYAHETLLRNIKRHKTRLEAKSSLRQIVGVKARATRGATREVYYLLNERQCLILSGSLKKGIEADEWHDWLVDQFLQARARLRELEAPPASSAINPLWEQRLIDFNRKTHIPAGYWSIFGMVAGYCFTDEFRGVHLAEEALPDGSIGKRWCQYLREQGYDMCLIKKYLHHYPDKRGSQPANIYPNQWLGGLLDMVS
jgi:hypothetical protein